MNFWLEYNRIYSLSCEIFVLQTYFEDATKANTASTHHYSVVTVRRTRCTVSATETAVTTTRRPNTTSRTSLYDCLHEERIKTRLTCFAHITCAQLKLGRLCRRVLENPVLVTPERTTMDAVKGCLQQRLDSTRYRLELRRIEMCIDLVRLSCVAINATK